MQAPSFLRLYPYFSTAEGSREAQTNLFNFSERRIVRAQKLGVVRAGLTVSLPSCRLSGRTPCGQSVDFAVDGDRVDSPWAAHTNPPTAHTPPGLDWWRMRADLQQEFLEFLTDWT